MVGGQQMDGNNSNNKIRTGGQQSDGNNSNNKIRTRGQFQMDG